VEAVTDRAHRWSYAHLLATNAKGDRGVLRALVGMMNDIARTALAVGHLEGLQDELTAKMVVHRPTNDATTERIDHHSQVQEAGGSRNVGDIGDPQSVRSRGGEAALHQIWSGSGVAIAYRRVNALTTTGALQTSATHQARYAFGAHAYALLGEFGMHPRPSVGRTRALMNVADALEQLPVHLCPRRGCTIAPCVKAAGGDPQQPTHGCHRIGGLIRSHEFESLSGVEWVSRANQAVAFAKISRLSLRFSRRSLRSSSRSTLLSTSSRWPASAWACATQLRMVCAEHSNSLAS